MKTLRESILDPKFKGPDWLDDQLKLVKKLEELVKYANTMGKKKFDASKMYKDIKSLVAKIGKSQKDLYNDVVGAQDQFEQNQIIRVHLDNQKYSPKGGLTGGIIEDEYYTYKVELGWITNEDGYYIELEMYEWSTGGFSVGYKDTTFDYLMGSLNNSAWSKGMECVLDATLLPQIKKLYKSLKPYTE